MKLIYNTKRLTLLALFTVALGACNKIDEPALSPNGKEYVMAPASIGNISIDGDANTKATASAMAVGSTFRLYAFEAGKTDMNDLVATHTYTIKTTAGEPVKDDPAKPLYLPVGNVDIYLVGPVDLEETIFNGSTSETRTYKIATATGVFPRLGCDLVASKTTVNIEADKTNAITLSALRHKMALVNVNISRKTDADYSSLTVKKIKIYNQSLSSTFSFDADGGTVAPVSGNSEVLAEDAAIKEVRKGQEYQASFYMIPRPMSNMKIEVNFSYKLREDGADQDRRLESGNMMAALAGGKQNYFYSNPVISTTTLWRTKILDWNEVDKDNIIINNEEDLVFSYSGLDAPVTIDGKKYWLDRSGNGRHAEIVGDMVYDAVNKCYSNALLGESYFLVPELGKIDIYTVEIALQSKYDPQSMVIQFADPGINERVIAAHIPWTANTFFFDIDGRFGNYRITKQVSPGDKAYLESLSTYHLQRTAARYSYFGKNGIDLMNSQSAGTISPPPGSCKYNRLLISSGRSGNASDIEKAGMRLYAVRMYKNVWSNESMQRHHETDLATYGGFHTKYNETEYIKDGLILNLDGTNAGSSPSSQWEDLSGYGNHATVKSSLSSGNYYPYKVANGYQFIGNPGYFKLKNSLGRLPNLTVEVVATGSSASNAQTLLHFSNDDKQDIRVFTFFYPYFGIIYLDTPLSVPGATMVRGIKDVADLPYPTLSNVNQWSITRAHNKADGLKMFENMMLAQSARTYDEVLPEMRNCIIGRKNLVAPDSYFVGYIHAVRVYNRVLTDKERQHNYLVDKKKYGILQ